MKKIFKFMIIVLLINGSLSAQNLTDGIVGYWPFEGNVNDFSGNNKQGISNGNISYVDGRIGLAASFDGIDDYIQFNEKLMEGLNDFTFACWFYLPDDLVKSFNIYRETNEGWYSNGITIALHNKNDSIILGASWGNSSGLSMANYGVVSNKVVIDNWYFLTVSRKDGQLHLYINSTLVGTVSNSFVDTPSINGVLGGWFENNVSSQTGFENGLLDEVRIYNRSLSNEEIISLNKGTIITQDTISYYVSSLDFQNISPKLYLDCIDTLSSSNDYDSIIIRYNKFIYEPNYFSDSISVTDTLIIDVEFTNALVPIFNTIKVYPNPTKDIVYINSGINFQKMTESKIRIISETGTIIFENYIDQQDFSINVSEFGQTGLYFIQLIDNTNKIVDIRKLILQ